MPDSTGLIVAAVSLVISIIAFVVTFAQALQQYFSSAEGYRKCANSVMGRWAELRHRNFRWRELRFEVIFEAPVLFLARPENKSGPIPERPIYNIDGSDGSYRNTLTKTLMQQDEDTRAAQIAEKTRPMLVHTADDEVASWVNLLSTLQKAEHDGRAHDRKHHGGAYRLDDQGKHVLDAKGQPLWIPPSYSLCVQLQARRRNWDYMPASVSKPYATSTISHVAEMAAMLGMQWKYFDTDSSIMRAEGNGLTLTSYFVQGLGVVFSFAATGLSSFSNNRIVPCYMVKDLIFGTVPTIFSSGQLKLDLEFGRGEVRRTLRLLKCDQATIQGYIERRHEHVRSVIFEIIAMIGEVGRIRGSIFRRLPNPTTDRWNYRLSPNVMMVQFQEQIDKLVKQPRPAAQRERIVWIQERWKQIPQNTWKDRESDIDVGMLESIHSVLEACTEWLTTPDLTASILHVIGGHINAVLKQLDNHSSVLNADDCDEAKILEFYFEKIRVEMVDAAQRRSSITPANSPKTPTDANGKEDIWLMLMFRMCCWWLLHDFDETDTVQLPPRLKGSRLPVFIL